MTSKRLILLYLVILLIFIVLHTAFCINKDCNSFVTSKQGKLVFLILIILAGYKNISLALLLIVLYIALNESEIKEGLTSSSKDNQDEYKKAYRTLFCLKCEDSKNFYSKNKDLQPSIFTDINNIRNKLGIVYNNNISSNNISSNNISSSDTCNVCDFDCKDWGLKVIEGMTNNDYKITSKGDLNCPSGYENIPSTDYQDCETASKFLGIELGNTVPVNEQTITGKSWTFANSDWNSGCFVDNNGKIFFNTKANVLKPSTRNLGGPDQKLVCKSKTTNNSPIDILKSFINPWISYGHSGYCAEPTGGWGSAGQIKDGMGYNQYNDVNSLEECKDKCDNESSFTCNAIAFGENCQTYHNCKMVNEPQDWPFEYYVKSNGSSVKSNSSPVKPGASLNQPCATNYGETKPCCGVTTYWNTYDADSLRICSASAPSCVGYIPGRTLGKCAPASENVLPQE